MVLLGALAVVASVTLNQNVYGMDMNSAWGWLAMVMLVLGNGVYLLLLSLFPDGRFVTRWASWLLLCWAVAVIPYFMFMSFMSSPFYPLIWLSAIGLVMIAQVYRYRTVSSPLQRQQVKWFIFGGCVAVIIGIGLTVLPFIFPALGQAGSFNQLVITPVLIVLSFIVPFSFAFAILRYRLWDIDAVINKALVYGGLSGLLGVFYTGLIIGLQTLFRGLTGQDSNLAIVLSTLAIAALFFPLRRRIQAIIDRHFYRKKYDAAKTLAAFSATLRDEVDLSRLSEQLVAVVEETMQPTHVSLWLCPPKRYLEETTRALPFIDTIDKP